MDGQTDGVSKQVEENREKGEESVAADRKV